MMIKALVLFLLTICQTGGWSKASLFLVNVGAK